MKIGIVITHPTQFDVPIFRLGKDCIDVIYTSSDKLATVFDPELNRNVKWLKNNLEGYNYSVLRPNGGFKQLFYEIKESKFDLLITNGYYNKYFVVALLLGKLYAKKNAIRIDSVEFNSVTFVNRVFKKLLYLFFRIMIDHYFVVSKLSKQFLLNKGINESRIAYYGYISDNKFFKDKSRIDLQIKEQIRSNYNIPLNSRIILCVSKHNDREAPFDTINAFSKLDHNNLHLVLIGDGPLRGDLEQFAKQLNVQNISFTGYIQFQDLPLFYSISELFVHDSHNEPWGVSVQEAIASGIPVIVSDKVGAGHDLIDQGVNGYMYEAGNINLLISFIIKGLKIDMGILNKYNQALLKEWNYESTLENIKAVARDKKKVFLI